MKCKVCQAQGGAVNAFDLCGQRCSRFINTSKTFRQQNPGKPNDWASLRVKYWTEWSLIEWDWSGQQAAASRSHIIFPNCRLICVFGYLNDSFWIALSPERHRKDHSLLPNGETVIHCQSALSRKPAKTIAIKSSRRKEVVCFSPRLIAKQIGFVAITFSAINWIASASINHLIFHFVWTKR